MSTKTKVVFLIAVSWWLLVGRHGEVYGWTGDQAVQFCDTVCGSTTDCNESCYVDQFHFDQDQPTTCFEYGDYAIPCCGDGICDIGSGQEMGSCNDDCGSSCSLDDSCAECDPEAQTGCDSGEICNNDGYCVPAPYCDASGCGNPREPPECYEDFCNSDNDCCSGDFCFGNVDGFGMGICAAHIFAAPR